MLSAVVLSNRRTERGLPTCDIAEFDWLFLRLAAAVGATERAFTDRPGSVRGDRA
jgi:hypothetical protein